MMRNKPIRQKLTVVIMATSGLALLLACGLLIVFEAVTFRRSMAQHLDMQAELIAAQSSAALAFQNEDDATEVLAALRMQRHIVAAALYDQNGVLFARHPANLPEEELPARPGPVGHRFGKSHLDAFQPVVQGGSRLGTLYLRSDTQTLRERLQLYAGIVGLVLLVSAITAYLLSRALQGQIADPILALAATARLVSERQDYAVRARKLGADEVGQMTDAFNQMLGKIQALTADLELRVQQRTAELGRVTAWQRGILDSASVTIISTDADGVIRSFNRAAERLLDYRAAEVVGKATPVILHDPAQLERRAEDIGRELGVAVPAGFEALVAKARRGLPDDYECDFIRRDGSRLPVLLATTALRDDAGDVMGFLGVGTDLTERKHSQAALEHERHLLRTLMDNLPDQIYFKNLEGRFLRSNRTQARRFGLGDPAEAVGRTDFDFFAPEHAQQARADEQQVITSGEPMTKEEQATWADGRVNWVLTTKLPWRDEQGRTIGTFGISRDITERKGVEESVRRINTQLEAQAAQLEQANRELESFSYSVSHDLRAPLRHIEGYVELLGRHAGATLDEKSRRYLRTVKETVTEMAVLIDDLLSFSRMSRVELRRALVPLDELVTETIVGLERETEGRNIEWQREPLPAVRGDPGLLKQVFVNLVSNALKYSRPRDPARIEIGSKPAANGEPVFFVRDNGVGFDMKYADKLFGVFQRLHHADEFEGTGIGLANVRRIVMRHGGRIWAEAAPGAGATFYFTLNQSLTA